MAGSTYSSNLKIELMTTGENSGTWGDVTNTNLGTALEQAVVGYGNPDYTTDANLTISITNSNASQAARCLVLNVTSVFGSLTQTRELVVPTIQKQYIVQNNTTGGQSITVKTSAGTGITVPNGRKAHLYVDGTNVIQMFDFVDINGGTIDGTTIGASSASTGAFTTLNASGATTLDGNVTLGNASGDTVTVTGTIASNLLFTDNTYDIGASGATRPRNLYLAGAATIGGNLSVGGTLTLTGGLTLNGNVTVGDSASDTLTINSTVTSNLIFTDNTYDIGASGATRPRNLFIAGNITAGGNQTLTGSLTVDSTTDTSSATTGSIQTDGGVGIAKGLYVGGNTTLGDASADTVTVNSTITSNLLFTDNTYDIGQNGATRPRYIYLSGGAYITNSGSGQLFGVTSNYAWNSGYYDIGALYVPNMTAGAVSLNLGKTSGTNNAGKIAFNYAGGSGSTSNYVEIGLFNNDGLLKVFGTGDVAVPSGNLSVGTSSATYKLDVSSSAEVVGRFARSASSNALLLIQDPTTTTAPYIASYGNAMAFGRYGGGESMRIDSSSRLLVGTNTYTVSSNEKFEVYNGMTLLDINSDSVGTLYVKNRSTTSATIQPYIYFSDSSGNRAGFGIKTSDSAFHQYGQGGINWYTGSAGYSGLAATLDTSGNLLLGSSGTASQQLTFYNSTGGYGIGWGGTTANYTNIFGAYSSGALVLAAGVQGSRSSDAYTSSYAGSIYRSAIRIDPFNGTGIQFFVNSSATTVAVGSAVSLTEVGRFSTAGYLGIGNNNPQYYLDVSTSARIRGDTATFWMDSSYSTGQSYRWIVPNNTYGAPFGSLALYSDTQGAYRLCVQSNGSIQIGDTSDQYSAKLYVNGAIAARNSGVDGTFQNAFVAGYTSNYTEKNIIQTAVSSAASGSGFRFQVSNGAGSSGVTTVVDMVRSKVQTYVPVVISAGDTDPLDITYNGQRVGLNITQESSTYNNLFRFKNNQTKWFDYTLTANTTTPTLSIVNSNGTGVALTWGSTSWSSTSDERVKDIIEPITNAVAKVRQLRAVIGKYKTDAEGIRRAFLLAQDVQNVLPEAVGESAELNSDGFKELVLRYTETIPLLVAAINELGESFESYVATHP